jgi:hypothetical protein
MLEPTSSLIALHQERPRRHPALARTGALRLIGWVAAVPFMCAALWAAATGAALLVWMATGWQAPLDWLRSGSGLIAVTALMAAGVLWASLVNGMPARINPLARQHRQSADGEGRAVSGWLLEEGRFELV